jgi:aspartyl-tRNA(Asn)/glutamyl-tRNA(Gln) amidotransferase subunit B
MTVKEVLDENPSVIEQFKNGRTNVIGFLVGQVIKKSKGQANPGLVSKVLNEKIKEY